MEEFVYDAFISYSHKDLNWAKWLQRRLESYRIPKGIDAGELTGRKLHVFRDQTDLAGVELQNALERELRASRYMILLCSPASAASRWVNEEVSLFRSIRGKDAIIPFIVEGEPESDDPKIECYPPALRENADHHPLGANVLEIGKNKAFLRLMAILLGVRFDRLVDRDRQRRRRNTLIFAAAAAAVILSSSLLLWRNAMIARENRKLSYDIYGIAIVSIDKKNDIAPEDVEILRISANEGNMEAVILLADCLLNGYGCEKDEAEAFEWYKKAADAGSVDGMIAMSNCYRNATGTERDDEQSFYWDMKAAEAGSDIGMLNTGINYEDGIGVEADPAQALTWYERSAEAGSDLGMYNTARCYVSGVGTERNPEKAFYWMEMLANTGNAEAMYNLGLMYQHGLGTDQNSRQAYLCYRKAAEAGDADGMFMTGWCTENSFGTENAALEWYLLALENGRADAEMDIKRLTEGTEK